jgi:phosphonate transport system ATP-binding protein
MLRIEHLSKRFGERLALDDVTVSVEDGAFVGVVGRSGAGKSTLLRSINRLETASHGRIWFRDVEVSALEGRRLRAWRARCAMIFQQFNLVGRLDVMANVLTGRLNRTPSWRSLLGLWTEEDKTIALSALADLDMADFAATRVDRLSGGQQQRVAIARALVQEPDIVLADEPVSSLDPRNAKIVMDQLARINKDYGLTVLCNLHSLELARSYCDRLIGLAHGRIVFDGPPAALTDTLVQTIYGFEEDERAVTPLVSAA